MAPFNKRERTSDAFQQQNKRWKGPGGGDELVTDPAMQEKALKAYMHHAVKVLHKAVKKSKTFELQKLTRKLKTTREPKEGVVDATLLADLEAQLAALKKVNLNSIPVHILTSRLPKIHSLRSAPCYSSVTAAIPPSTSKWVEIDAQSPEGKARNRVMANKAIAESWDEVVRAIRKRLGEEVEAPGRDVKGKAKAHDQDEQGGFFEQEEAQEVPKSKGITMDPGRMAVIQAASLKNCAEEGDAGENHAEEEGVEGEIGGGEEEEGEEGGDFNSDSLAALEAAFLKGRGDDDDDEEETSEDNGPVLGISEDEGEPAQLDDDDDAEEEMERGEEEEDEDEAIRRELAALEDGEGSEGSWSDSAAEDDDEEDAASVASDSSFPTKPAKRRQPSLSPSPPPRPAKKAKASKPLTSSAFLPTLASGYIGYDSDDEDAKWLKQAEKEDAKDRARKNRPGQRARRAMWEKEYGEKANHIVVANGGKPLSAKEMKALQEKEAARHKEGRDGRHRQQQDRQQGFKRDGNAQRPQAGRPPRPDRPQQQQERPFHDAAPRAQDQGWKSAPKKADGPVEKMHPSWEAKRKAAEALKQSVATKPAGKKIVFD
ncbi:BUD22 family protein [Rhodotorula toruloides]|uniref:BUD22 family protein n=1 Tax=Rhodotorula toruloides TaxID=5286 RepID=A0A511KCY7_RHOTO|nr:BUD22 family protein [Rhodotorula toruloides]